MCVFYPFYAFYVSVLCRFCEEKEVEHPDCSLPSLIHLRRNPPPSYLLFFMIFGKTIAINSAAYRYVKDEI